jgi:hypothetical protein
MAPSTAMANCISGANLVWDGRLVVDASFRSDDPAVMGAGPVAKFSRLVAGVWQSANSARLEMALTWSLGGFIYA